MTILVPQTWGFRPAYMPGFIESFRTANIVLNTASGTDIPAQPFVKQPGSCGEEGAYLHMTSEVFSGGMEEALGNLCEYFSLLSIGCVLKGKGRLVS